MAADPEIEKSVTLRLYGLQEQVTDSARSAQISVVPKTRVRFGTARAAGGVVEISGVQPDDVAALEYSNGFRLWTRVDDLYREQAVHGVRGMAQFGAEVWEIDPEVRITAERGAVGLAIETLEIFDVDVAGYAVRQLAEGYEKNRNSQLSAHFEDAIHRFAIDQPLPAVLERIDGGLPPQDKPFLIFIHGTGSSLQGGFGTLWADDAIAGREARAAMAGRYGDTAYAFEHRSLTASPIENALKLAKQLPAGAELHLVTHSRGGLVGELLCLGRRDPNTDPLKPAFLDIVFKKAAEMSAILAGDLPDADFDQRAPFTDLLEELARKQFKIARFVRVACPARGTSLASGRLDRWLSALEFLAPLAGAVAEGVVDFLLAIVKKRTDPRTLPGLEAMMPGSALTTLLNHPSLKVNADLTVIAGDCKSGSVWGRLKLLIADWFYDGDHDLMINTGSMYGGAQRSQANGRYFFHQDKDVNHFKYFTNAKTVKLLWEGLSLPGGTVGSFAPLAAAPVSDPARAAEVRAAVSRSAAKGPRPVAFVLPGTMGTELRLSGERIWLDYAQLSLGNLVRLDAAARFVEPGDLLAAYYGDLIEYLARSHQVVPFGYDWRLSIEKSTEIFAGKLAEKLRECEANKQPLRIIAHSMGGLVARMVIAKQPDLWRRICALPGGSRLIMLGTPNYGSFEAVRWLTGWNPTLEKLAILDLTHDVGEIVNLVRGYPGLLELLPSNRSVRDFALPATWEQLRGDLTEWRIPLAHMLQATVKAWAWLKDQDIDPEHMRYVAGCAPETISDVVLAGDRGFLTGRRPKVVFKVTWQGDGTVPWALGRLPGVTTWYVAGTAHDELPKAASAFPAYLELLQTGTTTKLPKEPPSRPRAAMSDQWEYIPRLPDRIPNEADLSGFVLGIPSPPGARVQRRLPKTRLSICHGNLAYARHPVCVGHYLGDTIVSAEAALDRQLDGDMSDRLRLGLYPGEKGSFAVFIHPDRERKPGGAIVIGLGQVGELSPGSLEATMKSAMLDYALKVLDWCDDRFGRGDSPRSARVSCLLIGTGAAGLSVRDSLSALLHGVRDANQQLADAELDHKVLIDEIEFLEMNEDIAIVAARELPTILGDARLAESFDWDPPLVCSAPGGVRRVIYDEAPGWWQRMEVTHDQVRDALRFIALTRRARAETTTATGQLRLADSFIREAIATTGDAPELSKTLFEMLIPNELKELAPDQYNLVVLVDDTSARYPWELLEDRWSVNGRPPSVAAGMLRQFKAERYRRVVAHGPEKSAYVVGNPKIPPSAVPGAPHFADLPGAMREAETVTAALRGGGYRVEARINAEARDILIGLHGDAYRILHLAGHGVHDMDVQDEAVPPCPACEQTRPRRDRKVSGMVIGNGVYLTPGDVQQMRWVPELVFINCCHLGSMEVAEPYRRRFGYLAANLAGQFIEMGVKAVVAAGWAVNDSAAEHFARAFYQRMLGGDAFGEAVRAAREEIYESFPGVNTWGAYQCYGDPAFRYDGAADGTGRARRPPSYVLPSELVNALENLVREVEVTPAETQVDWDDRIEALLDPQRFPAGSRDAWLERADVNAALATVYGELGRHEAAITHVDRALTAQDARLSVKTLEQRANYQVKWALERWLALPQTRGKAASGRESVKNRQDGCRKDIETAIDDLNMLCGLVRSRDENLAERATVRTAATVERLCLIGSAYKRLAWMQGGAEAAKALESMAVHYERAFRLAEPGGKIDAYPLANWVTAQSLRALARVKGFEAAQWWNEHGEKIAAWAQHAITTAQKKEAREPDFWNAVVQGDCLLFLRLAYHAFATPELVPSIGPQSIIDNYRRAFRRGGTARNRASVVEHLDFLLAKTARVVSDVKTLRGDLKDIREEIR